MRVRSLVLCSLLLTAASVFAATPVQPATPAKPATPATPATAAKPASPATPATPATPAPRAPQFKVPVWRRNGILVERGGRGLYTYDPDTGTGRSTCNAQCMTLWPPHYADADAKPQGEFTIVVRSDGKRQWAWQGKPLYRWLSDRKRGDAKGDGVADVWRLVRPPVVRNDPIPDYVPTRN